jgi:hypothetical protein
MADLKTLVTTIGTLMDQYLRQSRLRLDYCIKDKYEELAGVFGPTILNFTTCGNALTYPNKFIVTYK